MHTERMKLLPKWFALAIALLSSFPLSAQNRHTEKGDEEVAALAYANAIPHFLKAVKKGEEGALVKLARCYYRIRNYDAAAEAYEKLNTESVIPVNDYFDYGHILLQQSKYAEAREAFETYAETVSGDPRGRRFADALANMERWYRDTASCEIISLPFNSNAADFGAFPYQDGVVFSSSRAVGSKDYTFEGLNQAFLNLYYVETKDLDANKWKAPEALDGELRTKYHESSFSVSEKDSTTAWFSRNSEVKGGRSRKTNRLIWLNIYETKMKGLKGKDIQPFEHNCEDCNSSHPFITADGKYLYFSSDRTGGEGGKDLYRSAWSGSAWSSPQNLGPKVNTPGDEQFPFLHPDGTLYFASDGHPGFGHLDIFKYSDRSPDPVNLGAPINSAFDDFGYFLNFEEKYGYFSSNRPGGQGDDDIYAFNLTLPQVEILVMDSVSQLPVENARVLLYDENEALILDTKTDSLGGAGFEIKRDFSYRMVVKTPDFRDAVVNIDPASEALGFQDRYRVVLYNPPPAMTAIVVDDSLKQPLDGAIISLRRLGIEDSIVRETDRYGRFSAKLQPRMEYEMVVRKEGYYTFRTPVSTTDDSYDGDTIIPMKLKPVEIGEVFTLDNIYYEFSKWNLTPRSELELDKLVGLLRDNPGVSIELGSHTDSRGNDGFNQELSLKRALSARNYMVMSGIRAERIDYKGYGESQLVNRCDDGVECDEAEHAVNRRTEFIITGYSGKIERK